MSTYCCICFSFTPSTSVVGNTKFQVCKLCKSFADECIHAMISLCQRTHIMPAHQLRTKTHVSFDPESWQSVQTLLDAVNINFNATNVRLANGKTVSKLEGTRRWLEKEVWAMNFVLTVCAVDPMDESAAAIVSLRPVRLANGTTYLELMLAATAPKWQRQGVMKWLLSVVLQEHAKTNAEYVRVQSWKTPDALRFYQKIGFKALPEENAVSFPCFIYFGTEHIAHMECSFSHVLMQCII